MNHGNQPAPASRKATRRVGVTVEDVPPLTRAVMAVIWSKGKLMQWTWM